LNRLSHMHKIWYEHAYCVTVGNESNCKSFKLSIPTVNLKKHFFNVCEHDRLRRRQPNPTKLQYVVWHCILKYQVQRWLKSAY
jgi:hypothetical protein